MRERIGQSGIAWFGGVRHTRGGLGDAGAVEGSADRANSDAADDLLDAARHEMVLDGRRTTRDLLQRATTLVALGTTLRDLQVQRTPVTLAMTWGRKLRGCVTGVGDDHVVVSFADEVPAVVHLGYVAAIIPDPDHPVRVSEAREGFSNGRLLVEQIERWWEADQMVGLDGAGFDGMLRGWVLALGDDLLSLVREPDRSVVHVPISAIGLAWAPHETEQRRDMRGVGSEGRR